MTLTCNRLKEAGDRDVLPPFTRSCRTSIALAENKSSIDELYILYSNVNVCGGGCSSVEDDEEAERFFPRLPMIMMEQMDHK
jgi:hypothetical protein